MYFSFHVVTGVSSITLLVHWSVGPLVCCFIGPLVHWLNVKCHMSYVICHKSNVKCKMQNVKCQKSDVKCQMPEVNKVKLLSERTSGAPPVIFYSKSCSCSSCFLMIISNFLIDFLWHLISFLSLISDDEENETENNRIFSCYVQNPPVLALKSHYIFAQFQNIFYPYLFKKRAGYTIIDFFWYDCHLFLPIHILER